MASLNCPTEAQEQTALAHWLDARGVVWCHVPNGGARASWTGRALKAQGAKKGVPDVLVFTPPDGKAFYGVAIELKRKKGGRLKPEQVQWLEDLNRCGWLTECCAGADEAIKFLEELGY